MINIKNKKIKEIIQSEIDSYEIDCGDKAIDFRNKIISKVEKIIENEFKFFTKKDFDKCVNDIVSNILSEMIFSMDLENKDYLKIDYLICETYNKIPAFDFIEYIDDLESETLIKFKEIFENSLKIINERIKKND